jgi:hypothetical protein
MKIRTSSYQQTLAAVSPLWYHCRHTLTTIAIPETIPKGRDGNEQRPTGRHSRERDHPRNTDGASPHNIQCIAFLRQIINVIAAMPLLTHMYINKDWSSHVLSLGYQLFLARSLPHDVFAPLFIPSFVFRSLCS